ncbi:MAG: hypothetical protein M0P61_00295 [Ignavibacteriaceae bacterium]|jgi:hypothetical protein|nr:hypothetical protein [Ignavibacteriaceae bacterium]
MTTPQHGIQAALIQYVIYPKWYLIIAAALLGMRPDLTRLFQKNRSDWAGYNKLHALTFLNLSIPYSNIHILLDSFMHDKKTGEWKAWVKYAEGVFWVVEWFLMLKIFYKGKGMLIVITVGLLFVTCAALAESYEYRERYVVTDILQDRYLTKSWHWFQLFERVFAILFGYCLSSYLISIGEAVKVVFLIASVFWTAYDGAINIARNKNIFFISGQSTSTFDVFAHPWLKIGLLITSLIILLFL